MSKTKSILVRTFTKLIEDLYHEYGIHCEVHNLWTFGECPLCHHEEVMRRLSQQDSRSTKAKTDSQKNAKKSH